MKMAAVFLLGLADDEQRQLIRRERVFRDRTNPLDFLNDTEVIERYRLPREFLFRLIDIVREDVEPDTNRSHALSAFTQVNKFTEDRVRLELCLFRVICRYIFHLMNVTCTHGGKIQHAVTEMC